MADFTAAPWELHDGIVVCQAGSETGPGPILFVLRAPTGTRQPYPHEVLAEYGAHVVKAVNNHETLVDALRTLDTLLDFGDDALDNVWTFEDLTSIQAAFDKAKAALDRLTLSDVSAAGEKS